MRYRLRRAGNRDRQAMALEPKRHRQGRICLSGPERMVPSAIRAVPGVWKRSLQVSALMSFAGYSRDGAPRHLMEIL